MNIILKLLLTAVVCLLIGLESCTESPMTTANGDEKAFLYIDNILKDSVCITLGEEIIFCPRLKATSNGKSHQISVRIRNNNSLLYGGDTTVIVRLEECFTMPLSLNYLSLNNDENRPEELRMQIEISTFQLDIKQGGII